MRRSTTLGGSVLGERCRSALLVEHRGEARATTSLKSSEWRPIAAPPAVLLDALPDVFVVFFKVQEPKEFNLSAVTEVYPHVRAVTEKAHAVLHVCDLLVGKLSHILAVEAAADRDAPVRDLVFDPELSVHGGNEWDDADHEEAGQEGEEALRRGRGPLPLDNFRGQLSILFLVCLGQLLLLSALQGLLQRGALLGRLLARLHSLERSLCLIAACT
mmetsp:Transcript_45613/g.99148  ORF Transcript_45613/g.99148 Transcript_45613/m.99148 type:complete len:216 (-) Transcript_45613:217-864(-)